MYFYHFTSTLILPNLGQCPLEGQVYKDCINNCPSTCSDLRPSCDTTTCPNPGCECRDGEVLDSEDGKCIPRKDCGKYFSH